MTTTSNSTFSTAAASGGVAGAIAGIVCWLIGLAHIQVPAEVATAFMVVFTPLVHIAALRLGAEPKAPVVTAPVTTP